MEQKDDWGTLHAFMICDTCKHCKDAEIWDWEPPHIEHKDLEEGYACVVDDRVILNLHKPRKSCGCEMWDDVKGRKYNEVYDEHARLLDKGYTLEQIRELMWG